MKRETPFRASEMSDSAQRFLFACAFWMASADSRLHPGELQWLADQFGAEQGNRLMQEFGALDDRGFYGEIDCARRALKGEEKEAIDPQLKSWLLSLAYADSHFAPVEKLLIKRILKRFDIDYVRPVTVTAKQPLKMVRENKAAVRIDDGPLSRFHAQTRIHARAPSFFVLMSILFIGLLGYWMLRMGSYTYGPAESAGGIRSAYPGQTTFVGLVTSAAGVLIYVLHYARPILRWFPRFFIPVAGYGGLLALCVICPLFADVGPGQSTPLDHALQSLDTLWVLLLMCAPILHMMVIRLFSRLSAKNEA